MTAAPGISGFGMRGSGCRTRRKYADMPCIWPAFSTPSCAPDAGPGPKTQGAPVMFRVGLGAGFKRSDRGPTRRPWPTAGAAIRGWTVGAAAFEPRTDQGFPESARSLQACGSGPGGSGRAAICRRWTMVGCPIISTTRSHVHGVGSYPSPGSVARRSESTVCGSVPGGWPRRSPPRAGSVPSTGPDL